MPAGYPWASNMRSVEGLSAVIGSTIPGCRSTKFHLFEQGCRKTNVLRWAREKLKACRWVLKH